MNTINNQKPHNQETMHKSESGASPDKLSGEQLRSMAAPDHVNDLQWNLSNTKERSDLLEEGKAVPYKQESTSGQKSTSENPLWVDAAIAYSQWEPELPTLGEAGAALGIAALGAVAVAEGPALLAASALAVATRPSLIPAGLAAIESFFDPGPPSGAAGSALGSLAGGVYDEAANIFGGSESGGTLSPHPPSIHEQNIPEIPDSPPPEQPDPSFAQPGWIATYGEAPMADGTTLPYGPDGYDLLGGDGANWLFAPVSAFGGPGTQGSSLSSNSTGLPYGPNGYQLAPGVTGGPAVSSPNTLSAPMADGTTLPYGPDGYELAPGVTGGSGISSPSTLSAPMADGTTLPYGSNGYELGTGSISSSGSDSSSSSYGSGSSSSGIGSSTDSGIGSSSYNGIGSSADSGIGSSSYNGIGSGSSSSSFGSDSSSSSFGSDSSSSGLGSGSSSSGLGSGSSSSGLGSGSSGSGF